MTSAGGASGDQLPLEILENIFCQVPFQDLMRNCTAVCKTWNEVIQNPKFLIWKKTYNRLIVGCQENLQKVQEFMEEDELMESPELLTPKLCDFVKHFRRKNNSLLVSLKSHSKYHLISKFLEMASKSIRKSAWSTIALLAIVSAKVEDILEIIWTMMSKTSNCLVIEIIELLYLLATVFWVLKSQGRINSGLHYRIIYACHLFENSTVINAEPTNNYIRSNNSPHLTHEQLAVIKHNIQPREVIKIVAFAGTGKTTTLVEFTKRRPEMKFLNVAYNKSIQLQAQTLFPSYNVESRTIHSLAYRAVGYRYRSKLGSALRSTDVQRVLSDDTTFIHAERVAQTVKNFLASSRPRITKEDVTRSRFTSEDKEKAEYFNSDAYKSAVVKDAKTIWNKMINCVDKDIYMTHDGYLKLYQLSAPSLDGYDCILIDEAQDLTPAVSEILLSQGCSKIIVGDPHQQIYSFRGAENSMELIRSTHTFYLTQSFRFGPEIAYVANSLLEVQKDCHGKTLIGNRKSGGIMGDTVGQLAIICRSNFGVFSEASRLCQSGDEIKVAFAGGLQGYNLDRVLDIYHLYVGYGKHNIRDPLIRRFANYKELTKFVIDANDKELGAKMKIVETFQNNVPVYINAIKSKVVENPSDAQVIVSTAHKAKGLQFSTVKVNDDFSLIDNTPLSPKVTEADIRDTNNLLYVAVTRAQNRLILNKTIMRALEMNQEHLLQPVSAEFYDGKGSIGCNICYNPLIFDNTPCVLIEQPQRTIYNKNVMEVKQQGFLCYVCARDKMPYLECLLNPPRIEEKKKKKKNRRSSV